MSTTDRPSAGTARVRVVGISADGTVASPAVVADAAVVIGADRHLALLTPVEGQTRLPYPTPLREGLVALLSDHPGAVVLASGDPLISGLGSTLIDLLGADRIEVHPVVSSVTLARAAMGWPAESCAVVTVVGRNPAAVLRELAPRRRILVLSSDEHTPGILARLLVETGYGSARMTVLGNLGTDDATRFETTAEDYSGKAPRLNIVAIEVVGLHVGLGWTAGLPDEAYEHDGQLTKRDLRASALARLAPTPGERLWDVGAGAGSVGIEWMRAHPSCRTTAIEADAERAARIGRNATALGVPDLVVVNGRAPDALAGLDSPDAVFIGGGATRPGVLDACLAALRPGGRIVVHGVTLETEALLASAFQTYGGELTRISVETTAPVGT
ncbi:MAG TPA: precorrin-6y C5,15-methyltransferase (decarboxylating) subunit CbiE, partial [Nocardioides sp.]|nr:precorrin-6y C5,15-methyltransferase (decarboxylating) subunit CbiE [Nocardioides sp.]